MPRVHSAHSPQASCVPPIPLCLVLVGLLAAPGALMSKPYWLRGAESNNTDFLPPDVAFRVGAVVDGQFVKVRWVIADGYYLYRDKIEIQAESPDLVVSAPQMPPGEMKTDAYMGTQAVYTQQAEATAPYVRSDAGAHPIQVKVTYQGCASAGLCYPPITKVLFPSAPPTPARGNIPPLAWQSLAILGGGGAFLLAGLVLRRGRKLDVPA